MDDLERTGRLVEEVLRRMLERYEEHILPDDHRRRGLRVLQNDLHSFVIGAVRKVREETADPDAPSPYDPGMMARAIAKHHRGR